MVSGQHMTVWLPLFALFGAARCATSEQWSSRSIYQIVTDRFALPDGSAPVCNVGERKYCGGTWEGIRNKLPYIQGMGFDAIWISPVVQNFDTLSQYGQAYHGYWTQDINQLNKHFGTASDLKNLVRSAHDAGMYVMVDVTVNSMAWPGPHDRADYSSFANPFNTAAAFHPFCEIDYENATSIENCWLGDDNVALMDVSTEQSDVVSAYTSWIRKLIADFDFDGIRIDALKHVNVGFFPEFVEAAGVFALGENFQPDPVMLCAYQDAVPGLLNFPLYWGLLYAFNATAGGMQNLAKLIDSMQKDCKVDLIGNFIENHDLPRYAGITADQHQRLNALAFSFVNDGIPILYYGQEQAFIGQIDPYNREALWVSGYNTKNPYYTTIATLSAARRNAIANDPFFMTKKLKTLQHDSDYIALQKGNMLSVLFNDGIWGSNSTLVLKTDYPAHTQLIEVMSHNITSTDVLGIMHIRRNRGAPQIYFPYALWNDSIAKPNTDIEVNTHTTATTTVTTTYIYPTIRAASMAQCRDAAVPTVALMCCSIGVAVLAFMIIS